jgi:hypothetical protein
MVDVQHSKAINPQCLPCLKKETEERGRIAAAACGDAQGRSLRNTGATEGYNALHWGF